MTTATDFLAHYGVKGMKWGVHNGEEGSNGTKSERKAANKEAKLAYKDWKKEVGGEKVANEIFQDASKSFAKAVKVMNDLPEFKGKDLTKDRKAARNYDNLASQVFNQHLAQASIDRTMTNTGRAMIYQFDRNMGMMRATESQLVLHADTTGYPDFTAELDENGHIVSLTQADDTFVQQMDEAADFLAHYGVKGMKWGKHASKKVKEAPSEDAVRVGGIHAKVKSQKSTKPLSNKELQDAITRMNLEQQYSRLSGGLDKTRRQKGAKFVSDLIGTAGKQGVQQLANEQAKTQVKSGFEAAKAKGGGGS